MTRICGRSVINTASPTDCSSPKKGLSTVARGILLTIAVAVVTIGIAAFFCAAIWKGELPSLAIRATVLGVSILTAALVVTGVAKSCLDCSPRHIIN